MSGGINIEGGEVSFTNTIVGDHGRMTVNQTDDVHARVAELVAAIEEHRAALPDEVEQEAQAAQDELAQPAPQADRLRQAMERIREGAASVTAVAGAAGSVLHALGVA